MAFYFFLVANNVLHDFAFQILYFHMLLFYIFFILHFLHILEFYKHGLTFYWNKTYGQIARNKTVSYLEKNKIYLFKFFLFFFLLKSLFRIWCKIDSINIQRNFWLPPYDHLSNSLWKNQLAHIYDWRFINCKNLMFGNSMWVNDC